MRNKILILLALILCSISVFSQETVITPKSVKLVPNATGGFNIAIDFDLDMGDEQIDTDFWIAESNRPKVSIHYGDQKAGTCTLKVAPSVFPGGVSFIVSGFNEQMLNRFLNKDKDNQIKLVVESDIVIALMPKDSVAKRWIIPADMANKIMNEQLTFTEEDRSDFLTALNNFFYYENMVDFGVVPGTDDASTQYVLSMKFQNAYNRKNFLSCPGTKKPFPIYWSLNTRLSTDFSDSLNYIDFYPLNFLWEKFTGKVPYQFKIKFGNESSQDFANKRATTDIGFNFIIPNLINLTTAKSNRLRLKPVINAGVKGYYDYSNGIDAFASGQAFLNGHYYIPVFNNYAIIIDGGIFYDLSDERNPDKKVLGNYSITLGAEIPKTGFKAMFKYVDGKSDINFKQGSIISIGLLMDFFQEQRK